MLKEIIQSWHSPCRGGPTVKIYTIDNGAYLAVCCLTFLRMDVWLYQSYHSTCRRIYINILYKYFAGWCFFFCLMDEVKLNKLKSQIATQSHLCTCLFSSEVILQFTSHLNYTRQKQGQFEEEWKLGLAGCKMDRSWIYPLTVQWTDANKPHNPFVDKENPFNQRRHPKI